MVVVKQTGIKVQLRVSLMLLDWYQWTKYEYYVSTSRTSTFQNAFYDCNNREAELATIESREEQDFINQILNK